MILRGEYGSKISADPRARQGAPDDGVKSLKLAFKEMKSANKLSSVWRRNSVRRQSFGAPEPLDTHGQGQNIHSKDNDNRQHRHHHRHHHHASLSSLSGELTPAPLTEEGLHASSYHHGYTCVLPRPTKFYLGRIAQNLRCWCSRSFCDP